MKIGLVLERFDPRRGGLENWTWQFARSLAKRGHEVHVVAFEFNPEIEMTGVVADLIGELPRSRIERAEMLAAKLPAFGFDVVHDMGIGWQADIIHPHAGSTIALWEQNLLRIPKWRQIRFWREKRHRELAEIERRQHQNSGAMIVPLSRMLQRNFEELHQLPSTRMRLVYNGVDGEQFTPENQARYRAETRRALGLKGEVMFLMLAHNLLLKNAEVVIRAAAILMVKRAPVRVVIAGGKKPERFIKLADKLGVSQAISFLGLVEALPYYAAADVYVHPTWYDPCSLVTLEASASGLPVITTRCNGASELMTNGKEGFVLDDPSDATALAARMEDLIDERRREQMGAAGRELALHHSFEDQTTRFLELYQEIVAAKARV